MVASRPEEEDTLEQLADWRLEHAEPEVKRAIANLLEEVTVANVTAALAAVRGSGLFVDVLNSLGAHHPDELLDAILPGHAIDPEVDVRLWTSKKYVPDWMGDLRIDVMPEGGLAVAVGSTRGAGALRRLGRGVRAAFLGVSIAARDGEDRRVIEPMLAEHALPVNKYPCEIDRMA